jgi:hypothetical protein
VQDRGLLGVFMIQGENMDVTPLVRQIQAGVLAALDASAADVNADGVVSAPDLSTLLGSWGACAGGCAADVNRDGVVDARDLSVVLGAWGQCG